MKILFYLGHPAHYHLFKNAIWYFKANDHSVHILIKKKDVLEDLLKADGLEYINIFPKTRGSSKFSMAKTIILRNFKLLKYCLKHKPDILVGTSVENTHIGKLLGIPSINVNEDDHTVVPLYSQLSYPLANVIVSPTTCTTGRWEHKTIHYKGYHELAYLHPNNFSPKIEIAQKYVNAREPYFVIRFAKLTAHHDKGISGINDNIAIKLIKQLKPYGRIIITSEKKLDRIFEPFRLNINPADMHHVMAFAKIYIGDSQTMAAEAGVLGIPFIRFNDFVDKIGYLNELENKYKLGFGVRPSQPAKLFSIVNYLLNSKSVMEMFQKRRIEMLKDKIDFNRFLIWFIEKYPLSRFTMEQNPSYQMNFASEPLIETGIKKLVEQKGKVHSKSIIVNQV
jgi:predicted glycosyltransferase